MPVYKRSVKIVASTLLIYALLVATHLGEFWPFSIYPMFSQGANPWTRSLVRDYSGVADHQKWTITDIDQVDGEPVALSRLGVDQIDLSNFISKTENWDHNRLHALRTMFGEDVIAKRDLMIIKANGLIQENDEISVEIIPFILLTADSTYLNPGLSGEAYFKD
ncbi:MAG: hypothetical protein WD266_01055 [Balneolales bacterium]